MAQFIENLLHKHEDLSVDPRDSRKTSTQCSKSCNPSSVMVEASGPLGLVEQVSVNWQALDLVREPRTKLGQKASMTAQW